MTLLDEARWRVIEPQLDRALELEGEARAAFLAALRDDAPDSAALLEDLLAQHESAIASRFLEAPPELEEQASLAGQSVGPYTLVALLGSGGMGAVWRARRSDGRFTRTWRSSSASVAARRRGEARFRREGTLLSRLAHPASRGSTTPASRPAASPTWCSSWSMGLRWTVPASAGGWTSAPASSSSCR